ncbi:XP_014782366.1PREDICTED: uncharacterized protein LOC106877848 [Octopus vulgaris]|uniref:XP_014782366.1PREDICTED: uncharacterized protein LOC106877848 n=1 Tax=Octopus vulgaris TaxID=6645 RepID=A0AA36B7G2_OCTVU|nr:XP_014782366.1PREDICTED: uncharacterized protein LOC106877848 [Octopus vulgaris]
MGNSGNLRRGNTKLNILTMSKTQCLNFWGYEIEAVCAITSEYYEEIPETVELPTGEKLDIVLQGRPPKCYLCGMRGHMRRKCPNTEVEKRLETTVEEKAADEEKKENNNRRNMVKSRKRERKKSPTLEETKKSKGIAENQNGNTEEPTIEERERERERERDRERERERERAMEVQNEDETERENLELFKLKDKEEQMEETSLQPGEITGTQTEEEVNEAVDSRRKTQEKRENERKKKKCRVKNKCGGKSRAPAYQLKTIGKDINGNIPSTTDSRLKDDPKDKHHSVPNCQSMVLV